MGEFVATYEASWFGVGVPRARPEIIYKLNQEINAGLADPKIKARLVELGGTVLAGSPTQFGKLITEDTEKWMKVIGRGHQARVIRSPIFRNARSANGGKDRYWHFSAVPTAPSNVGFGDRPADICFSYFDPERKLNAPRSGMVTPASPR